MPMSTRKRPTSIDVARLAGVNIATVSRVVNNKPSVSVELRKRVAQAIRTLDYKPSPAARSLAINKQETIGLVTQVESESSYYGTKLLEGVALELSSRRLKLAIGMVHWNHSIGDVLDLEILKTNSADGYIFDLLKITGDLDLLLSRMSYPYVFVNPAVARPYNSIVPDDTGIAKEATQRLISKGHKNIGYIPSLAGPFHKSQSDRMNGYSAALINSGLLPLPLWNTPLKHDSDVNFGPNDDYMTRAKLLTEQHGCTAFVTYSSVEGARLVHACCELGIKIPEDVSIIA